MTKEYSSYENNSPSKSGEINNWMVKLRNTQMIEDQKLRQVKVGDSVFYWAYGTPGGEYPMTYRAAIVTQVAEPDNPASNVGLCVINPTGIFFNTDIPWGFSKSGHWSWITE